MMAQVRVPASAAAPTRVPSRHDVLDQIRERESVGDYETSLALREHTLAALVRARDSASTPSMTDGSEAYADHHSHSGLGGEIAFQAEELVKLYCCLSLDALNRNDFSLGFDLLQKAQRLVEQGKGMLFGHGYEQLRVKARCAVLNNIGLFYYRTADYKASVAYLAEAHRLEVEVLGTAFSENPGATMLNLAQAYIACADNKAAVPVLRSAIQLLADQASHAAVTIQADDAVNLMIHCMSLLGHCLEATEDFNGAADIFSVAVDRWKVRRMNATDAPSFENRLRELQEDMRRCQEKALRLPTIPLRATRPAKTVAPRDKRGTKEHSYRLQLASGHPEMQHERIVTTTLPATLPAPVWTQRPPTVYTQSDQSRALAAAPSPYTQGLSTGKATVHRPSLTQTAATSSPAATAPLLTPENVAIPVGAVDVDLANNNRTTPQSSRLVFTTAPGLEKIYQQLDPQFKEAFDTLAAASPIHRAQTQPHVYPESVLYGNRKNLDVLLQQKTVGMKNKQHRNDYDRPWNSRSVTPSNATPRATPPPTAVASVHHASLSGGRPASAPKGHPQQQQQQPPIPRQPSRPQSGRPAGRKPQDVGHSSPLVAMSSATFNGSVTRDAGGDDVILHADGRISSSPSLARDAVQASFQVIISTCAMAKWSEMVVQRAAESALQLLQTRLTLRREEAIIARADARRQLDRERARMERELAEAKLLMESRRRVSGPLAFTPSSRALLQTADDPAQRLKDDENLHRTVRQMLASHAECALEKAASIQATEELTEAIHVQHDETERVRHNAALVVQRFIRLGLTRQILEKTIASQRVRAIAAFTSAANRRLAQRRVNNFLQFVVGANRAKLARFAAEEAQQRRLVAAVTTTTLHLRTQLSSRLVQRIISSRLIAAATAVQSAGRGYSDRILVSFRQRERAARAARELEHAGKVIVRAMRRNLKLNRVEARWQSIEEENMLNKQHFATTRIQSQWRRHRYGYPVSLLWKENHRMHQLAERLRLEGIRHAAEVLRCCVVLQRAYRMHLARRQLEHRKQLREHLRRKYLYTEMRTKAALTLQAFARIVVAKGAARRLRETEAANLRARRIVYELERQTVFENASNAPSTVPHQPPPLAPRHGSTPLVSLAAYDLSQSRVSSNASKTHQRSNEASPTSAAATVPAGMTRNNSSPRHVPTVEMIESSSHISFSPNKSASSTTHYGSPALFVHRNSSYASSAGGSISSALEQAILATTNLVRRLQLGEDTTLDASALALSQPRPAHINPPAAAVSVAPPLQQSAEQRRGSIVLVRFFRMLRRRRLAQQQREGQRRDTIRHESARFIQDCWRRYLAKRRLRERQTQKLDEQRSTMQRESASIIQSAFRRYRQ